MEQKGKYQTQVKSVFISNFPNTVNYGTFFHGKKRCLQSHTTRAAIIFLEDYHEEHENKHN